VPIVRPFRALRYSTDVVPDLGTVVAPPYDVISPDAHRRLLARDPRNVVRLDFPQVEPGDADDDERYRRAARLLRSWRSDGTLRREPRPAFYAYEQAFQLPGAAEDLPADAESLVRRGIFARLTLEAFGPGSGVRPHERTMSAPKEDRYRLLRATDVNTSPVVGMYDDPSGDVAAWLDAVATSTAPVADLVDDDGVRHRLWAIETGNAPGSLAERLGAGPITIADGHHRYETAIRYRDERRRGAPAPAPEGPSEPAPWDEILVLLLEPVAGPVAVLATHRVVRGLGPDGLVVLRSGLGDLFDVEPGVTAPELARAFAPHSGPPAGEGRFGLWTRDGGAILRARRAAFGDLVPAGGGAAVRRLDVSLLGGALERLAGIDAAAVDAGVRIAYTKDAAEAIRWVDEAHDGGDAAFLLDPTPAADIAAVAAEGDVMPQKSTYIYPKALTGLVINPLE
jgi:uncharacterized protein (DUF1015 family)